MEIKVVFLIIGVIYWVLKSIYGKKDATNPAMPKKNKAPRPATPTSSSKSFDEIYKDFIKEVENKKNPQPKPKAEPFKAKVEKKAPMDWQQVSKTKIVQKKQLLKHEDYHAEHGKIEDITSIDKISDTEGEVYQFEIDNIDWKQAIITKEILDKKYA